MGNRIYRLIFTLLIIISSILLIENGMEILGILGIGVMVGIISYLDLYIDFKNTIIKFGMPIFHIGFVILEVYTKSIPLLIGWGIITIITLFLRK